MSDINEKIAEIAAALVMAFGVVYVLWQVYRAVMHHAFQVVTR
jgi:ABC-type thiamin/hydroxymethylpyrimidine transport system permease subunit